MFKLRAPARPQRYSPTSCKRLVLTMGSGKSYCNQAISHLEKALTLLKSLEEEATK